jgi:indole-3-glycerol phosphate synthase
VVEARALGADAVLLIVAILDGGLLGEMLALVRSLDMAALVEVHDEGEVERALRAGTSVLGVNNRDLRTFAVDLDTTRRLRALVPPDRLVVSESGIHTPADVARLRAWGVDAMLVGESLVRSGDVAAKVRELLG